MAKVTENLQLIAASPNCPYVEFPYEPLSRIPEAGYFMLTEPFMIDKEGLINVPDKPCLGKEL